MPLGLRVLFVARRPFAVFLDENSPSRLFPTDRLTQPTMLPDIWLIFKLMQTCVRALIVKHDHVVASDDLNQLILL